MLAAPIIKTLDRKGLTVRKAEELAGIATADFSDSALSSMTRGVSPMLLALPSTWPRLEARALWME